ncbi:MAG: pyruvate flavodoxin/ferredoxin oxidoreductase domain-containing protein [Chloroflexi bacterium OLB15]|nr:MAG: pyruvate flavodoxin/ferredoxin oxidoreductase domain-containing protein [Chloroflexi bacterium OLB15]
MVLELQPQAQSPQREQVINDFALMVATKNGSGSQTSNEVLIRSLFRMGIPVSGKNLFPSNIKGLPTWYTIRASRDGYVARSEVTEIAVTFNELTAAEDIQNLPPGGVCIIPADWKWGQSRTDIVYYEVPVKETVAAANVPQEFRDRIANMVYVGVCAHLFGISIDIVRQALLDTFNGKEKPAMMNFGVAERAALWAQENLTKRDPFLFEPMDKTAGKILITGNEAAALGSIFGGLTVAAWYPITPSTSVIDGVLDYKHLRTDPETGKETVAVVQAEDELAAIGMLIGAGWAGARAMTSTSGPGISLMAEFTGLAYFAEIPCVVWDIARMGPSTGLPTRTSQGDLLFLYVLSHGDTRQVVLLPSSVAECFEFGWRALDLADQLQTPVFVMSDLDLGMNIWLSEPFQYPDQPIQHGKTLDKISLEEFFAEHNEWARYRDYDGDGIPYRTVPGTDHPRAGYFTRGTGHTESATYSERREDWVRNMDRLRRKYDTARTLVPQPVINFDPSKKIGIVSYGSNDPAIIEARDRLAAAGIQTNYLRIRALPLNQEVYDFVTGHEKVYVIENNFDGQMAQILNMEISQSLTHMVSLSLGDTLPMTAQWIVDNIVSQENK